MPAEGDVWSNERIYRAGRNYHAETGRQGSNLQRSHVLRQGSFDLSLCIFYTIIQNPILFDLMMSLRLLVVGSLKEQTRMFDLGKYQIIHLFILNI